MLILPDNLYDWDISLLLSELGPGMGHTFTLAYSRSKVSQVSATSPGKRELAYLHNR